MYNKSRKALCAAFALALAPMVADAQGVMVQVPVERPIGPKVAYYCRIQIPTEGGRYFAGRTLDADGRMISDSISWQDGHTNDKTVVPQISIKWWSENAPHRFDKGVVNFVIYGQKPMGYYLQLRFDRADTKTSYKREAGPIGGPESAIAISYFPLIDFTAFAQGASEVPWALEYQNKYDGPIKGKRTEGLFRIDFLKSAAAAFDQINPALEAKQANYKTTCTTR